MRKTIYKTEFRSALIAAVVAVVVAAPLSNAAHEGVSSAVKIVKGKQGKRGPRGFRGATGPQGPQGERGPAGRDASAPNHFSWVPILPGETQTILARCTGVGQTPTGGDVVPTSLSGFGGAPTIVREGVGLVTPIAGDVDGYFAVVRNDSDDTQVARAEATC